MGKLSLTSYLFEHLLKLDPPLTRDLTVQRDLRVPMDDGTALLADRWAPASGGAGLPVALIRGPYGRGGLTGAASARPFAERGFQVVLQSVRGTFGSGGAFEPFRHERADGRATLAWVIRQPWFGGSIVLVGASYLGFTQWAVGPELPPEVKAMIPVYSESGLTLEFLRPDGFSLEALFRWGVTIDRQEQRGAALRQAARQPKIERALRTLPLSRADTVATGHRIGYVQDVLARDATDPCWSALNHRDEVAKVTVPVSSVGGWYDVFLPGQLRDFAVLQSLGRPVRLTVGPWTHTSLDPGPLRETLEFGLAHARGQEPPPRAPVRLYVMGQDAWRDFDAWPPPGYSPTPFYLRANGELSTAAPSAGAPGPEAPDRYRYDPADPTPTVGGARMHRGGRADNTALEARGDVLTYTTAPLDTDAEVVGEVTADIWLSSTARSADVFVRLCDVDERGRSWNICDGLTRLTHTAGDPGDADETVAGSGPVSISQPVKAGLALWPTAYRFRRGHRIRVQVSSGAFPRYARNLGTGDPQATATRLVPADQAVYHDPARPSAIILPLDRR